MNAAGDKPCADLGNHLIVELSVNSKDEMYVPSGTFKCVRCGMEFLPNMGDDTTLERIREQMIAVKEAEREARD